MVNRQEMTYIVAVVKRAENMGIAYDDRLSMLMDVEYSNLDAERLLGFSDINFAHDIVGLNKYFNRNSKQFDECFLPRSSR